mgnify:CR=1 FL=1
MDFKQLIYIGPTLSGYRLVKYQVFIGGYPAYLQDIYEKFPQIKMLFVAPAELNKAEADVKKKGTPLNKYYRLAMEV